MTESDEGGGGDNMGGGNDIPEAQGAMDVDVLGEKLINNGLLCSILHVMSGAPKANDMISRIERDCDVTEILETRKNCLLTTVVSSAVKGISWFLILTEKRQQGISRI